MANPIGKAKPMRGKSVHTNKHKLSVHAIIDSVVREANIILEILDARFIEKTRNHELEKKVKKLHKPLIYVLNKSDLINQEETEKNIELQDLNPKLFFSSKQGEKAGRELLLEIIEKEAEKINSETVNIGIIGYPNTGKSSLINFLTGKHVSRTSPEAGHTHGIQKLKIGDGLYLIDTPGIIPMDEKTHKTNELLSKHSQIGAITWDRTKNPEMVVHLIMQEYPGVLENHYKIDACGNSEILLDALGKRFHFLKKHGLVDDVRTAKQVLKEWQEGKIRQ
ncbi:MAG: 50S ribosome-binding GTPase [Candidatus Pacearchaeota archaeon]|nr:50S ribosome-binding GTPase [Candidatus Pacearchaeota archaeon]